MDVEDVNRRFGILLLPRMVDEEVLIQGVEYGSDLGITKTFFDDEFPDPVYPIIFEYKLGQPCPPQIVRC